MMAEHVHASDESLAEATRAGDTEAYAELWRRHAGAGKAAARQFHSIADPDDIVSEAYLQILRALQAGGGPHEAFRPYMYRTVRNVALNWNRKAQPETLELSDELESSAPLIEDSILDKTITIRAFRTLPERWQTILWYTEVEGMEPAEVGPLVGLSSNAAAALAHRARAGLKKAWLQAHVSDLRVPAQCRWTTERMGDYVQDTLSPRTRQRFNEHLDSCTRCSILLEEMDDLSGRLAAVLLPAVLGGGAGAALLSELRQQRSEPSVGTATRVPRSIPIAAATIALLAAVSIAAVAGVPAVLSEPTDVSAPPTELQPSPSATADPPEDALPEPSPPPAAPPTAPPRQPPAAAPVVAPDAVPPASPVLLTPGNDTLTNESRPLFTGSGEPGARVEGRTSAGAFSGLVSADGTWQLRPPTSLPDGLHAFQFDQVDAAGNRSGSVVVAITIDTTALAPTIDALPSTLVFLPLLHGSGEPGATVDVTLSSASIGTVVVDSAGFWSLQLPDPGADGVAISATQIDRAGNSSLASAPSAPLVFDRPEVLSPAEGEVIQSVLGATVVTLTLTGLEGMQIEVLIDGVATGNLHTLEPDPITRTTTPLSDGSHTIAVRYRDPGTGQWGSLAMRTIVIQP